MQDYDAFLASKRIVARSIGPVISDEDIHPVLFPFQKSLVRWSVRKGRAAIFARAGLGKTGMSVAWGKSMGGRGLIVAPLAVARQTVRDTKRLLGIDIHATRSGKDLADTFNITNYEMIHAFNPDAFDWVVLDESSILKAFDGAYKQLLVDMFRHTPYKLCCTATPAPNDIQEIANHAEFLGIMTRNDMLAQFFIHDADGWRLRKHGRQHFWRWLASWGMSVNKPSDLGDFDDTPYQLPPLTINPIYFDGQVNGGDALFFMGLKGVQDRNRVRREVIETRLSIAADLVQSLDEPVIIWHRFNEEGYRLRDAIPGSVLVEGKQSAEVKTAAIEAWQDGQFKYMISKPEMVGHGMNWQHCAHQVHFGLSDSYENFAQSAWRSHRFGQSQPVQVDIILANEEAEIYQNIMRKSREADTMSAELIKHVREFERTELEEVRTNDDVYTPTIPVRLPNWLSSQATLPRAA